MITQRLLSAWNFSLFMHHSKFVNHSGTLVLRTEAEASYTIRCSDCHAHHRVRPVFIWGSGSTAYVARRGPGWGSFDSSPRGVTSPRRFPSRNIMQSRGRRHSSWMSWLNSHLQNDIWSTYDLRGCFMPKYCSPASDTGFTRLKGATAAARRSRSSQSGTEECRNPGARFSSTGRKLRG